MSSCLLDIEQFQIGNQLKTYGKFRNTLVDDALIDPGSVYCDVLDPNGVETTYTVGVDPISVIGRESPGVFFLYFYLDAVGYWYIRWYSDGLAIGSAERTIRCVQVKTF